MRLLIIRNPVAGRRRKAFFEDIVASLRERGGDVDVIETERAGHAAELVVTNGTEDYDRLIIAGGDGTVNEAVNGLMHHRAPIPFAILPMGTANVLAIEIGLNHRSREAVADYLINGQLKRVHLGVTAGRYFMLMAGAGFDAHVVHLVSPRMKRAFGKFAYAWCMTKLFLRGWKRRYVVECDGQETMARSVIVTNAAHYGGPYRITERTDITDPTLAVFLFDSGRRRDMLRDFLSLARGRLEQTDGVRVALTKENVTIKGGNDDPVQVDGDDSGMLPMEVGMADRTLPMVWPAA